MTHPTTLLAMAGRRPLWPRLGQATFVLIDYQNEYVAGALALPEATGAIKKAKGLLDAARAAGARIVHVAHRGSVGTMFDRTDLRGAFCDSLTPAPGEAVVEKTLVSAFDGTNLIDAIGPDASALVFAGFMTHNCVSSTVRAALALGRPLFVAADACATRDLPRIGGGVVTHGEVHAATLAALADRHAFIAGVAQIIAEGAGA